MSTLNVKIVSKMYNRRSTLKFRKDSSLFTPHSSIISLCEYTSLIFFEEQSAQDLLLSICVTISRKFSIEKQDFLSTNNEVFIEFLIALSTIMRKRFQIFTAILSIENGEVANTLFEMLHLSLEDDQNNSSLIRASGIFLVDYWKTAVQKHDSCKGLAHHFLNRTISIILNSLFANTDINNLNYYSDILFQISKVSFPEFNSSIKMGFEAFFQQTQAQTQNDNNNLNLQIQDETLNLISSKKHFERNLQSIIKERGNRNKFREYCKEWYLLSRNLVSCEA